MTGKSLLKRYKKSNNLECVCIILIIFLIFIVIISNIERIRIINDVPLLSFEDSYKNLLKSKFILNENTSSKQFYIFDTPFLYSSFIVLISQFIGISIFESMLLINILFTIITC